jgi:hypothetical protein
VASGAIGRGRGEHASREGGDGGKDGGGLHFGG